MWMGSGVLPNKGAGILTLPASGIAPLHQWDGNGDVRREGDTVIVADGAAVAKWMPTTANTGIFVSVTPTGALRVGPPRGLQNAFLTLPSSAPSVVGTCVFIVVCLNSLLPYPHTEI